MRLKCKRCDSQCHRDAVWLLPTMIEYKQKYTAACKSFRVSAVMLRKYSPLSPTQYSTHQSQCCLLPPCRKITFNRATICKCGVNVNVNVVVEKVKVLKKKKTMKRGCLENHCHLYQLFLGIAELVTDNNIHVHHLSVP